MDEMKAGEGGGGKLGKEDYTQLRETSSHTRMHWIFSASNVLFLMTKHWEKQRMSTKLELILRNVNIFCKNNYTKSKVTHPTQVG